MLLYIPSIVVTTVLVLFAIYAMWTRGIDFPAPGVQRQPARVHRAPAPPEALAA